MSSSAGLSDPRGVRLGTESRVAADRAEEALWRMMTFADSPRPALDAAREADPGWVLPSLLDAGERLASQPSGDRAAARVLLDAVAPRIAAALPRERAHWQALVEQLEGRPQAALRIWDELLLETPRDALALHWAHLGDLARGDARSLRVRPARVLPEWDDADPLFPCVLGLYAFGLAECQQLALAEDLGRRAVALAEQAASRAPDRAGVPAAVHAVTHAMELQGRFDDGASWLRQQQARWADGSRFATHLWWHLALFRLEALDVAGTLRLIDTHLCGDALDHPARCVDAAALYWRLRLMDVEVDALFNDLLRRWRPDPAQAGAHALTDWHVVLALLGAGRARAGRQLGRALRRMPDAPGVRRAPGARRRP